MEVALAVVVVGVGVLGLFALISGGLDSSVKAVADTQAAFFAEAVFNGLRAKALEAAQSNKWDNLVTDITSAGIPVPCSPAAPLVWVAADAPPVKVGSGTVVFKNQSLRTGGATGIENFALRYKLEVPALSPSGRRTYTASLWVLPGQYPSIAWNARDKADATMFYSEFPNMGSL
jgi:hypothetical protein